jgi:chromosome segregation ATPase
MMDEELSQLEERVHRLLAAYRQAKSEQRRAEAERDRLLETNRELRGRIERIVARIRALELEQSDG